MAEEAALDAKLGVAREGVASARALREDTVRASEKIAIADSRTSAAPCSHSSRPRKPRRSNCRPRSRRPATATRPRTRASATQSRSPKPLPCAGLVSYRGESQLTPDNAVAIMGYCKSMGTDETELRQFLEIGKLTWSPCRS